MEFFAGIFLIIYVTIGLPFTLLIISLGDYYLEKAKYTHCMGEKLFPEKYKTLSAYLKERKNKKCR